MIQATTALLLSFALTMFFRSAVDPWFYFLVVFLPLAVVGTIAPLLCNANSTALILAAIIFLPVITFPTWLLFSTYYRVDAAVLRIHAGPLSWSVPLDQIRSITPSRSLTSSPALSLNRLKIEYGYYQHVVWVSPKHKTAFLEALGYHHRQTV